MGQYHCVANLDKREFVDPHKLACGLKLWEQLASHPGTGGALVVLLASASNGEGGGDLKPADIVGRWRGDRIAFVGDYDDQSSYATGAPTADKCRWMNGAEIYGACHAEPGTNVSKEGWRDVSAEVCAVIERELQGKFKGTGWRDFDGQAAR